MPCPACGHANRDGARFCEACGSPFEPRCPACGSAGRPGAAFCDACGQPLAARRPGGAPRPAASPAAYTPRHLAERILTDGRALRGERKEVTVLFVDVQGSTELAGLLEAEAFHQVMDGAFQCLLDAVHRWEGTVNQFTGDGIMALFGAPIAQEDHARRACQAALEIRRGLAEYAVRLRRERGLAFQARLGLNSGAVVVGAIGDDLRMDYTAQGLTTNLAARMQQAADPGRILVAPATYRLAEGYFVFRPLGPISVRGVAEPVEVFELEREGSVTSRLEASLRRGISPFRGRERELGALGQVWERVQEGRGAAVCLVGEPGIGKSRLALEFQRSIGLTERIEASALAHARGVAYFAARQLLRHLAGVAPDADLAAVRDTLHRRLWDLSPALADQLPRILFVLGAACEPPAAPGSDGADERRDRLRDTVVEWVRAECRAGPRVLVVEDLQWLDPSSEELLAHLVVAGRDMPLLVLMTSRLPVRGSDLELAGIAEIPLDALSPEDVHAVVDAQVEPYPAGDRLRRVVAARAEGNPFYAEELVRAFRDEQLLFLDDGSYELREGADRGVPPTISALIAARADRLPVEARELLADAAVLGMHFPLAHLRAMSAAERFDDDLALIERRGLLDRRADGPVESLAFRHVLTQEVVQGGLLQPDRQARHGRAAQTLERLYRGRTEEVCDQLGHHWARSDRRARAFPYLLTAADGAVAVGANREAITHLEAALALAASEPELASDGRASAIRLKLAALHFFVGER